MKQYPFTSPVILTDAIYTDYGGHTGTSTANQRSAAYYIAESLMTDHLEAYLTPVIITGSYPWPKPGMPVILDSGYLNAVKSVKIFSPKCNCNCELLETSGCSLSYDDERGWIFVQMTEGISCSSCSSIPWPWKIQVAYDSGLQSGSVYRANMLAALTTIAEIALNEISDPGANESSGDIGVQEFQNQSYREIRTKLKRTALGSSARANYAARLVQPFVRSRQAYLR